MLTMRTLPGRTARTVTTALSHLAAGDLSAARIAARQADRELERTVLATIPYLSRPDAGAARDAALTAAVHVRDALDSIGRLEGCPAPSLEDVECARAALASAALDAADAALAAERLRMAGVEL